MGKAVIASNTSIKVNAAVSAAGTNDGTNDSDTLYTCPASSYAIVQLSYAPGTGGTASFKIDGNVIADTKHISTSNYGFIGHSGDVSSGGGYAVLTGVYIGPSQVLSVTWNGTSTNAVARVTGVEFINSP